MKNKAQITLETILIIAFFILILVGVSIPMSFKASQAGRDTTRVLEMRSNLEKISSAIQAVQALGPGTMRTVRITSNSKSWAIATGDPVANASISYWIEWESRERVASELLYSNSIFSPPNHFGGLGKNITGIVADRFNYTYFAGDGKGSFEVRVENNNTAGGDSHIYITRSGNTISIVLAP